MLYVINAGRVGLLEEEKSLDLLLHQLRQFPNGKHNDLIDSFTQALLFFPNITTANLKLQVPTTVSCSSHFQSLQLTHHKMPLALGMGAVRQTSPSLSIHLISMSTRSLKNATRWEQRHGLVWMYYVLRVTFASWIDCETRHGWRRTSVDCAFV